MSALVISLSATTLVGSAAASPSAPENQGCSALAQERNEGVHRLHEVWQGFSEQLRDLARETRDLGRESHGSKSAATMTVDARAELSDARAELSAIRTAAHADLQDLVELGTACKEVEAESAGTTTPTTATTTTTSTSASDDLSFDTSDLVKKYRDVVDQAIEDMQEVMDTLNADVAEMLAAGATQDTSDDKAVTESHAKAKADREKSGKPDGAGKPEGPGKPADKGGKGRAPRG